jgi:hypothetical protein
MVASRNTIHVCGARVRYGEGGSMGARLQGECDPVL